MTEHVCLLQTNGQDTGALVKSGDVRVIDGGNTNIIFTLTEAPNWTKEHNCVFVFRTGHPKISHHHIMCEQDVNQKTKINLT